MILEMKSRMHIALSVERRWAKMNKIVCIIKVSFSFSSSLFSFCVRAGSCVLSVAYALAHCLCVNKPFSLRNDNDDFFFSCVWNEQKKSHHFCCLFFFPLFFSLRPFLPLFIVFSLSLIIWNSENQTLFFLLDSIQKQIHCGIRNGKERKCVKENLAKANKERQKGEGKKIKKFNAEYRILYSYLLYIHVKDECDRDEV